MYCVSIKIYYLFSFHRLRKLLLKIVCVSITVLIEILSFVTYIKAKLMQAKAAFWFGLEASYTSLKLLHNFFFPSLQETKRGLY